jgi:hypothetical protein
MLMTIETGEDGKVTRIGVAITAGCPFPRVTSAVYREPCVIKNRATPGIIGMALRTGSGKARCYMVGISNAVVFT